MRNASKWLLQWQLQVLAYDKRTRNSLLVGVLQKRTALNPLAWTKRLSVTSANPPSSGLLAFFVGYARPHVSWGLGRTKCSPERTEDLVVVFGFGGTMHMNFEPGTNGGHVSAFVNSSQPPWRKLFVCLILTHRPRLPINGPYYSKGALVGLIQSLEQM